MSDDLEFAADGQTAPRTGSPYLIPIAIVIAGLAVGGAIFATHAGSATGKVLEAQVLPVTAKDHVRGSRDADVYLIEYSDFHCEYCGMFHDTIEQVLQKYGGRVAWVYRHTPYQPGAKEAAVASECIAEQKGDDAFWAYADAAFKDQRAVDAQWSLDEAKTLGVDVDAYTTCIHSGKYDSVIAEDTRNAQELGGNGTPYNVLLTKNGDMVKFAGAQPLDNVTVFVDRALRSLDQKNG